MNFPFHNDMISPSSAETKDRLKNASSFGDFLKRNLENMLEPDLSKYLMELLAQKGLKRAQVVEDSGTEIITLTPEELSVFAERTASVGEMIKEVVSPSVYDAYMASCEAYQASH